MHNKYEKINDYDYKMIEAYIGKPEVTQWYVNAFKRFNINGVDLMKWHWSWWAFFGSVFFLLYRKAYTSAGILFIMLVVAWFIPFGWFVLWILSGGYAPFFVYKAYKENRLAIEAQMEDESKRIETMQIIGGTNEWALAIGILAQIFFWSTALFMFGFIVTLLSFFGMALSHAG